MDEKLLKEKRAAFQALLERKEKEFDRLSDFQEDQLESVNRADLDRTEFMENMVENRMRDLRIYNESLDHLKDEINQLSDYESFADTDEIGPRSMVKTSFGNFLVSVAEEQFEADGTKFTGISTRSPLYQALEGKKEGDTVKFRGQEIEVNTVV